MPKIRASDRVDRAPDRGDHGAESAGQAGPGASVYRIVLRGRLGERLFDAFSGLAVSTEPGRTTLVGPIEDQAALQGVLVRIQSLGLELEELCRMQDPGAEVSPD